MFSESNRQPTSDVFEESVISTGEAHIETNGRSKNEVQTSVRTDLEKGASDMSISSGCTSEGNANKQVTRTNTN